MPFIPHVSTKTEASVASVEAAIAKAKGTGDVFAAVAAIEVFFEFFKAHRHEFSESSGDPYIPAYTSKTTEPVVD